MSSETTPKQDTKPNTESGPEIPFSLRSAVPIEALEIAIKTMDDAAFIIGSSFTNTKSDGYGLYVKGCYLHLGESQENLKSVQDFIKQITEDEATAKAKYLEKLCDNSALKRIRNELQGCNRTLLKTIAEMQDKIVALEAIVDGLDHQVKSVESPKEVQATPTIQETSAIQEIPAILSIKDAFMKIAPEKRKEFLFADPNIIATIMVACGAEDGVQAYYDVRGVSVHLEHLKGSPEAHEVAWKVYSDRLQKEADPWKIYFAALLAPSS